MSTADLSLRRACLQGCPQQASGNLALKCFLLCKDHWASWPRLYKQRDVWATPPSFCKSGTLVVVAGSEWGRDRPQWMPWTQSLKSRNHWGKDRFSNKCSWDKWVVISQKIKLKLDPYLTPHTRSIPHTHNPKWIREFQEHKRKQTSIRRKSGRISLSPQHRESLSVTQNPEVTITKD